VSLMDHGLPAVIYIGGYGRSGSTLLDRILGQHPKIFSGGELHRYGEFIRSNLLCSCGKAVPDCEIWSDVDRLTDKVGTKASARWLNSAFGLVLKVPVDQKGDFVDDQRQLFQSIASVAGAAAIVDSSKTSYGAAGRPAALYRHAGIDLYFIHLVRHPYSVWASLNRGTNKQLEGRLSHWGARRMVSLRAAIGWRFANAMAVRTAEEFGPDRAITVRYEDLIYRTKHEIERLGNFLHLDLEVCFDVLSGRRPPREQHVVEGNRSRSAPLHLKTTHDVENLSGIPKLTVDALCGELMRKFGYAAVPSLGS